MTFDRSVSAFIEIAHRGNDGRLHGHSLQVEAHTEADICLDAFRARLDEALIGIEGELEETIHGRTYEDVASAVLQALPAVSRVVVRLLSRGHAVECTR